MLIWDTGVYEVLPYYAGEDDKADTSSSGEDETECKGHGETEQEKLTRAFGRRKIKLRLHGTRLPRGYTLSLRLTRDNDRKEQPQRPRRRRRRRDPRTAQQCSETESDKESNDRESRPPRRSLSSLSRLASPPVSPRKPKVELESNSADDMADAADDADERVRLNNAYIGATNDIGSIHQRKWYLSIDRQASGFERQTKKSTSGFTESTWVRRNEDILLAQGVLDNVSGFDRFVIGGREAERSVVTGRYAKEVLADEGIEGYVPRGLWRPITE